MAQTSPPPLPKNRSIDDPAAPANHTADRCHRSRPSPPPPRRVNHTYRDFSRFNPNWESSNKKSSSNFPAKLHMILSNPDHSHVICWMPHGRAWKILNKELLVSEVLPLYFVQTKYESFTRQLCGWGFTRLHQPGPDFRAYYHECFLRGLPHLTQLMKRVPANLGRSIPHVEGEPNFYEMSKSHPLPGAVQSTHYGFGAPPTYHPSNDVLLPHSNASSSPFFGPPPPPNANYGHGYGPPPPTNSEFGPPPFLPPESAPASALWESNGYSYSHLPHPSSVAFYTTPRGGSRYNSSHAPSSYTPHHEHSGYYGSTSFHYSQPPLPQQQYLDPVYSSHDNHSDTPDQNSLSLDTPDTFFSSSSNPLHDSDSDERLYLEPLPFTARNDMGH